MEDLLKQGEALFAEGKLEEAEKCFLSLLEENHRNEEVLNNLGVINYASGNVQEAEDYFLKALTAKDDYLDALLNLADLYQNGKRWEEAALQLEKSIAIDNQDPNLFNRLGMVYLEMGNTEKAGAVLSKSLELNSDQEVVRESLRELEKGDSASSYLPTPGSFRGAFAEINITPNVSEQNPVFLQGMGGPPRKATAISTPLMMQMFLLEDDHFTKILFITADLFGFGPEIVQNVRALVARWAIEPEGLILNASHTHYALGTISHASKSIGPFYSEYAKHIIQAIGQQLPILYDKLEECKLSWGKVEAQIGVSRRLKKDGKVVFAPNPEGYYDKETPFILLHMLEADKKILLVNHGCHPTGLGSENVISADYPWYMRNALKSNGGMDGVMFLQGGAGSTKESVCINGKVRFCENSTEAKENGESLAIQIINGHKKGLQPVKGSVFCTRRQISLPLKPPPPPNVLAQVRNNQDTDALVREWASSLLNRFPNGDFPAGLAMEIQLVSLGDKVSFVTLPGEPVAELTRDLRRLTSNPDSTFVLGYTNGLIGYLPTDVMIEEGGYETEGSQFAYLLPSALNTGTESAIISATEQCVSAAENRGRPNGYGRYHLAKKKQKAFFVLSAGRCGTMTLAHLLNTATNARVWHHPQPDPIKESLLAYLGNIDKRKAFWKARYPIIHKTWSEDLVHGETDLLMTPFCDMLDKEILDAKFIVLVRDPRDFVRSGMRRNYYHGHPWDFGRLRPQEGTEEFERWDSLDQFGKVCWLWHKTYEKTNRIIDQLGRDRVVTVRFENLVEGIEKTEELFNFLGLEGFNSENIKKLLSRRFNEQVTGTFPKPKDWSEKLNETLWNLCGIIANHFGYQDTYEKKNSDSSISTNQQCLSSNTHNSEDPQFTGQRSTVDAACIRADIPNNLHKFLQANRHKSTSKHLSQDDIFIHLCRKLNITKHGYTSDKIPFVETANGLIFFGLPNHKDINKLYTNLNDGIKNCFPKDISAIIFEVGSRFFNDAQHKRYTYRKGDVVVELGAYLGYYSMNAAQKIGPSGRIIAVEFVPENYEILYKNLSVNFPDNAQAILKGVSNKKGRKKIYAGGDQVNSFRQDIVSRFRTDFATIEIETDTVDNILKENDINKVDLMIIQLNGNELDALMGIKDSMAIIDNFAIAAPYELDGQSSRKIVDEFLRRNEFATEVSDVWVYAKRKRSCLQKVGRNVCQPNCIRSNERGETGSDYKDTISVEEAISINMDNSLGQAAKNGKWEPMIHRNKEYKKLENHKGETYGSYAPIWDYKKFKHQKYPDHIDVELFKVRKSGFPLIAKSTKIASMGSCFARNIAEYLLSKQYNYLVTETPFQQASAHWDQVFNTACIRQIFEYTFDNEWRPLVRWWPKNGMVQDPFRRSILYTEETCDSDFARHRKVSYKALTEAEVIILTLGLIEIWRDKRDKMTYYRVPSPGLYDQSIHEFYIQNVSDCLRDLNKVHRLLQKNNPNGNIIVTVSPVPLFATFRMDVDVVTANLLSKSTLRVAAEYFSAQHDNVHYFPSYEIVTQATPTPYEDDNRHVTKETVNKVMNVFESQFMVPS